jgi:hypothetical protein
MSQRTNEGIRDLYSHTSRVWNSAVTLLLAGMAFSLTVMFSDYFKALSDNLTILISVLIWGSGLFGFLRIVELGCQLQYLESQIILPSGLTLSQYSEDIPRIRALRRYNPAQAQQLRGINVQFTQFGWQHVIGLIIWTIIVVIILLSNLNIIK